MSFNNIGWFYLHIEISWNLSLNRIILIIFMTRLFHVYFSIFSFFFCIRICLILYCNLVSNYLAKCSLFLNSLEISSAIIMLYEKNFNVSFITYFCYYYLIGLLRICIIIVNNVCCEFLFYILYMGFQMLSSTSYVFNSTEYNVSVFC